MSAILSPSFSPSIRLPFDENILSLFGNAGFFFVKWQAILFPYQTFRISALPTFFDFSAERSTRHLGSNFLTNCFSRRINKWQHKVLTTWLSSIAMEIGNISPLKKESIIWLPGPLTHELSEKLSMSISLNTYQRILLMCFRFHHQEELLQRMIISWKTAI
jgi:hypothetical protein